MALSFGPYRQDEELRVEPLLFSVSEGQLRWFGHLIRMPPGYIPLEELYITHQVWEWLGIPQEELQSVSGERDVGNSGWMDG